MASMRTLVCGRMLSQYTSRRCIHFARQRPFKDSISSIRLHRPQTIRSVYLPIRWHSAPASNSKLYEFDQIKKITESTQSSLLLIDVREPSEVNEGFIPTAINIPVKSQPDALMLPNEEFEDRYGFSKPEKDVEMIFYCRSGVRSSAAAQLAQQNGYQNVAEYRGSWLDWQEKGGPVSKP